jgi:hypothetical protein
MICRRGTGRPYRIKFLSRTPVPVHTGAEFVEMVPVKNPRAPTEVHYDP